MNVVRVVRAVEAFQRRGFESGTILEVGPWFGSFALPLRRLGYDVVAATPTSVTWARRVRRAAEQNESVTDRRFNLRVRASGAAADVEASAGQGQRLA